MKDFRISHFGLRMLALLLLVVPAAFAQNANPSLYSDSNANLFLFRDLKARSVGDILTIRIVESATATNSANTSTQRSGDVSVSAPALAGLERGASSLNFANILQAGSAINFAGNGTTSRSGQLEAFVSARVTEVLPNGDLVIEGVKEVVVNRERQILGIRGIVRSFDVAPTNVVLSTAIANMEVQFNGRGVVSDANKPGWFSRILQIIAPF
jgi:flagellar L-ring protein precursor FlgH